MGLILFLYWSWYTAYRKQLLLLSGFRFVSWLFGKTCATDAQIKALALAVVCLQFHIFADMQDGYDSKLQHHLGCYSINIDWFWSCRWPIFRFYVTVQQINFVPKVLKMKRGYWLWVRASACECVWVRVRACECVWVRVSVCECVWVRVSACECVWVRVSACECVWGRVSACEYV